MDHWNPGIERFISSISFYPSFCLLCYEQASSTYVTWPWQQLTMDWNLYKLWIKINPFSFNLDIYSFIYFVPAMKKVTEAVHVLKICSSVCWGGSRPLGGGAWWEMGDPEVICSPSAEQVLWAQLLHAVLRCNIFLKHAISSWCDPDERILFKAVSGAVPTLL